MNTNKKISYILGNLVMKLFLGIIAVLCLYPILYILLASFSDPLRLVQHTGLLFKPLGFTLKGYEVGYLQVISIRHSLWYLEQW